MTRIWLAATSGVFMLAGAAVAQTATSTTTYQSTVPVPVPPPAVSQTTVEKTVDSDGVITDHTKTVTDGTAVTPYGGTTTTRRTTETTTVR